jgi:hypothetical protein
MIPTYNPYNNYWLADDGRVWGSIKQTITTTDDPDYVEWLKHNSAATPWPRDLSGQQTEAELQSVVGPLGMFVNLKYYNADRRWRKEQGGITLSLGWPIKTDDRSQSKINGARWAATAQQVQSTEWLAADGTYHTVSDAEIITISNELQLHIDSCFDTQKNVDGQVDAGTITTREQVDAAYA